MDLVWNSDSVAEQWLMNVRNDRGRSAAATGETARARERKEDADFKNGIDLSFNLDSKGTNLGLAKKPGNLSNVDRPKSTKSVRF